MGVGLTRADDWGWAERELTCDWFGRVIKMSPKKCQSSVERG